MQIKNISRQRNVQAMEFFQYFAIILILSGQLKYFHPNKYVISVSDNLLTFLFWSCWHLTTRRAIKKGLS
jgi:hypothetical protein